MKKTYLIIIIVAIVLLGALLVLKNISSKEILPVEEKVFKGGHQEFALKRIEVVRNESDEPEEVLIKKILYTDECEEIILSDYTERYDMGKIDMLLNENQEQYDYWDNLTLEFIEERKAEFQEEIDRLNNLKSYLEE